MLAWFLITFCTILIVVTLIKSHAFQNKQLPPGPVGVPILGYLPFLDVFNLGKSFGELSKKFGDVFSIKVGTELAVVLNTHESIVKAFSQNEMCARPDTFMFRFFSHGEQGIASASGETWEVQRKFTYKNLRDVGFGKSAGMKVYIEEGVNELVEELKTKSRSGRPIEIGFEINVAVINIILALVSGKRKSHDDPTLLKFVEVVNKSLKMASTSGILLFMPFLIKLFPESFFGIDKLRQWRDESYEYLQETVDEHKSSNDPNSHRDFIDAFLNEINSNKQKHPSFNEFQLLIVCLELFGAGGEPTSVTLKWALRYLALNPEVQRKAQEELDRVVGQNRNATLDDKADLPYFCALIYELIRLSDIHPLGVLHSPSRDTEIEGFKVPKGTFVFPNFHKVHRDPNYWEHPDQLYPEHWLDSEGRFIGGKRQGFLAFGVGKRRCPGQEVAVMELFCFLSQLLQTFTFKLPADDDGSLDVNPGVVNSPKPYSLLLTTRT